MRRWIALLLLALLPVQFTWAAVADHRAHLRADAGHGWHHDHGGHANEMASVAFGGEASDAAAGAPDTSAHPECDHCHGTCAGLPVPATSVAAAAPGEASPAQGHPRSGTRLPAQPERPQWRCLA